MENIMSFEKFNYGYKLRKSLNMLVVKGVVKGHLLWRDIPFELIAYYTPMKKKLIDFNLIGIDMKNLEMKITIGDDIQSIKDWAKKCGYQVNDIATH